MARTRARRPPEVRRSLGRWIRERRKTLGLSLRDVERSTGISRSVLSGLEQGLGEHVLTLEDWEVLSRTFEVGPIDLMYLAGTLRKEIRDIGALLTRDVSKWDDLRRFLENQETVEIIGRSYAEPSDPAYFKAKDLLLTVWLAAAREPEVRRSVEDYLRFQLAQLQSRGSPKKENGPP